MADNDKKPKFSKLRSALGGLQQGTTLGFGDELGGLAGALGSKAGGDKRSFSDLYQEARDANRADYKQMQADNPTAYLAGNVGGSLLAAPAAGLGALGTGAAIGLGNSNADLTQGNVGGALADTAIGAGTGYLANKALNYGGSQLLNKLKAPAAQLSENPSIAEEVSAQSPLQNLKDKVGDIKGSLSNAKDDLTEAASDKFSKLKGMLSKPKPESDPYNAVRQQGTANFPDVDSSGNITADTNLTTPASEMEDIIGADKTRDANPQNLLQRILSGEKVQKVDKTVLE